MATFKAYKVVANLPSQLEPDALYLVRVGAGFDLYASDATGNVAHKLNGPVFVSFATDAEAQAYQSANPSHVVFSREGV